MPRAKDRKFNGSCAVAPCRCAVAGRRACVGCRRPATIGCMLSLASRPAPPAHLAPCCAGSLALPLVAGVIGLRAARRRRWTAASVAFEGQNLPHRPARPEARAADPALARPAERPAVRQHRERCASGARRMGERLLFAANAGIYDRKFAPLGLYVENGRTVVPLNLAHGNPAAGNFSLLPNGVFAIYPDGHAAVRTSAAFKADGKTAAVGDPVRPDAADRRQAQRAVRRRLVQPEMAQRRLREDADRGGFRGERGTGELPYLRHGCSATSWAAATRCTWMAAFRSSTSTAKATPAHRPSWSSRMPASSPCSPNPDSRPRKAASLATRGASRAAC